MSKQVQEAYICAATRLPIGRSGRGYYKNTRPDEMLARAIQAALAQVPGLDPKAIEDAIIGCSFPEAEQGMNIARVTAVLSGLPNSVGGVTVNRYCASGITALQMAADRIRIGEAEVMIAGGVESMSMVPMGGNKPSFPPAIFERDENIGLAYGMGLTAEKVAAQWKISREDQDAFALESHRRALAAIEAGHFRDEMTPFEVLTRSPNLADGSVVTKKRIVDTDEGPRRDTSLEGLAKLRPVFAAKGSVTAGNSSQTSDGAAALIVASEAAVKRFGLTPLARFVSFAVRGVPPEIMGHRPDRGDPGRAEAGRHQGRGPRLDRAERSLCRAVAGRAERPRRQGHRARPQQGQPERRRDRAGPPAGRYWCHPRGLGDPRPAPHRRQVRHGDDVRRRRPGCCRHHRATVGRCAVDGHRQASSKQPLRRPEP